jgi:sodium transport system permease protein
MNWKHVSTIFKKETVDNLRDKRTLLSSFSLSVLSPLLFVGLMVFILDQAIGKSDSKPEAHLIGAEHAPALVDWAPSSPGLSSPTRKRRWSTARLTWCWSFLTPMPNRSTMAQAMFSSFTTVQSLAMHRATTPSSTPCCEATAVL